MQLRSTSDKPYYSLNDYLLENYGEKLYKLSLDGGMTCPNRDGHIDTRGCIFCSAEHGSGDFATSRTLSITEQIETAKARVAGKFSGSHYIAYFQAFTNTYADVSYLEKIFTEAIMHPDIKILSIATRPDCLPEDVLELLSRLNRIKPVWLELGLQTIHQKTADYIRRGYALDCYEESVRKLHALGIPVITHVILGLPGETKSDMLETVRYLNKVGTDGVKLQLLHVLKDTDLADDYLNGQFRELSLEEYIDIVIDSLEALSPDIVIHRLTGDGPKKLLVAPLWSANKKHVLNTLHGEIRRRNTYQGKEYTKHYGD
ncbi:MAG: TIGR01212 family radical SAM protein [Lachnospiraceae bacterium]|nr:TIGR01212 family radical SAM protein [Lachnospiraceae bacterium]